MSIFPKYLPSRQLYCVSQFISNLKKSIYNTVVPNKYSKTQKQKEQRPDRQRAVNNQNIIKPTLLFLQHAHTHHEPKSSEFQNQHTKIFKSKQTVHYTYNNFSITYQIHNIRTQILTSTKSTTKSPSNCKRLKSLSVPKNNRLYHFKTSHAFPKHYFKMFKSFKKK